MRKYEKTLSTNWCKHWILVDRKVDAITNNIFQGPFVQSIDSFTSSLMVKMLTVLVSTKLIHSDFC